MKKCGKIKQEELYARKSIDYKIKRFCNEIKTTKEESVLTNQLVRGQVSAQISEKRFMRTEKQILLQNCKLL